jgi:hypothetical protein
MNANTIFKVVDVTFKVAVAASLAAKAALVAVAVKKAASFETIKNVTTSQEA